MPNPQHIEIIHQGVITWNTWRKNNPHTDPDLSRSSLSRLYLRGANLSETNLFMTSLEECDLTEASFFKAILKQSVLSKANLQQANLHQANLRMASLVGSNLQRTDLTNADLWQADLSDADLFDADLSDAQLKEAKFTGAKMLVKAMRRTNLQGASLGALDLSNVDLRDSDLTRTDLRSARLRQADLRGCKLRETQLADADLEGCHVYGISVWNICTNQATNQSNLLITHHNELTITVDNLEVAQFIHSMIENARITQAINTLNQKCVLILGRFKQERKSVLDAIREELRKHDLLPILFDFEKPSAQTTLQTVVTLAGLAHFVIADISDPACVMMELDNIVKQHPKLPVQPILDEAFSAPGMWDSIAIFPWVLPIHRYSSKSALIDNLYRNVVQPALAMKNNYMKP